MSNQFCIFLLGCQVGPAERLHPLTGPGLGEPMEASGQHESPVCGCQRDPKSVLCGKHAFSYFTVSYVIGQTLQLISLLSMKSPEIIVFV